jgi:hypothetical protein
MCPSEYVQGLTVVQSLGSGLLRGRCKPSVIIYEVTIMKRIKLIRDLRLSLRYLLRLGSSEM